ncbi:hypothetical protein [Roseovarius indicus]|nr:hypothetical protein [Roseovarius indicus]KRS16549.1 hypothetical protein XM52_18355 [Roseovarius indicus]
MPNFVERYVSQSMVSHLSGIKNDVLRDWRRRQILDGVGEQNDSRRWQYSLHETVELAIVRELLPSIPTIVVCQWIAGISVIPVTYALRKHDGVVFLDTARPHKRFWAFRVSTKIYGEQDENEYLNTRSAETIEELWQVTDPTAHAHVIDADRLALSLPRDLRRVMLHGLAGPGRDGVYIEIGGEDG